MAIEKYRTGCGGINGHRECRGRRVDLNSPIQLECGCYTVQFTLRGNRFVVSEDITLIMDPLQQWGWQVRWNVGIRLLQSVVNMVFHVYVILVKG